MSKNSPDPVDALVAAVKAGDTAEVGRVLKQHPALKKRLDEGHPGFDFGGTALIRAVNDRNMALVDLLLDAGADINQRSHWWAGGFGVLDNDSGLAEQLIRRGATVDAYAAARHGMMDVLASLVAADPSAVRMRGGDGQTPLHVARNVAVAQFLLEHGAELDARDVDHESTPAQYHVHDNPDVTRLLISRGCATDILMASAVGDVALVRRLLDEDPGRVHTVVSEHYFPRRNPHSGGTIYIWQLGGNTSAHVAAHRGGHEEVYRLLMARSPDALQLAVACEVGEEQLVRDLLARDPGLVRALPASAQRKLVDAAEAGNLPALRRMLAAGWPLDVRGKHGGTALHWAAWHGNAAMVGELLRYHAPLTVRDDDHDQVPMGWALHGSLNSWHAGHGDYGATVRALLDGGSEAPDHAGLAASDAVLDILRRHPRR